MSLSTPWLCIDSLWCWYQNSQCFHSLVFPQQQNTAPWSPALPGKCVWGRWYARNDRLHLPSSLWRKTPSVGHRVPFVCLGMCSCDGLCGPSPGVENQSNVLFKRIKTIQKYQIHQLGVDLSRNMALPREAFKKRTNEGHFKGGGLNSYMKVS